MQVLTLSDLIGEGQAEKKANTILPEAQIMELRAALKRYTRNCPFEPGYLVTALPNAPLARETTGMIFIVLETFAVPVRTRDGRSGEWSYYGKCDFRIASVRDGGDIVPFMAESWMFDHYTGEGA